MLETLAVILVLMWLLGMVTVVHHVRLHPPAVAARARRRRHPPAVRPARPVVIGWRRPGRAVARFLPHALAAR